MDKIYTVTMVEGEHTFESHCVGWFHTYEEAKEAVISGKCSDSYLSCYKYAVIEVMPSGVHPRCEDEEQKWFEFEVPWIYDDDAKLSDAKFIACKELEKAPEYYHNTFGFSMG